jgi:hypothetical protein
MKIQSFKLFVATLVIGIISVGSVFAQNSVNFEIPFDFQIGNSKMESGKYQIRKMGGKKFLLKNTDNKTSMFVIADTRVGIERDIKIENIVFNRYGDTYFLREIYTRRGNPGREIGESKAEKRVRGNHSKDKLRLAQNKLKPEQVSIKSTQ